MSDQPRLCECGCGALAPIATVTNPKFAHVKGEPMRFLRGHNAKVMTDDTRAKLRAAASLRPRRTMSAETRRKISLARGGTGEASYTAIHIVLKRDYPKAHICEKCGKSGPTDYAFQHHPAPHTRLRSDYRELCRSCHHKLDAWLRPQGLLRARRHSRR